MKKSQLTNLIKTILSEMVSQNYRFDDFKWLNNIAGFGIPSDVYYGTIYVGTIESDADGYRIVLIDTPSGKKRVKQEPRNKFKSKNEAAEVLHRTWKYVRREGMFTA